MARSRLQHDFKGVRRSRVSISQSSTYLHVCRGFFVAVIGLQVSLILAHNVNPWAPACLPLIGSGFTRLKTPDSREVPTVPIQPGCRRAGMQGFKSCIQRPPQKHASVLKTYVNNSPAFEEASYLCVISLACTDSRQSLSMQDRHTATVMPVQSHKLCSTISRQANGGTCFEGDSAP